MVSSWKLEDRKVKLAWNLMGAILVQQSSLRILERPQI
jgi:hypothetical protein